MDYREGEGDEEADNEPDIDHLGVRRGGQLFYLGREDGRHDQHDGQVHGEASLEVFGFEEGGHVGGDQQEQGGQVGGQHLRLDLPLQGDDHVHLKR